MSVRLALCCAVIVAAQALSSPEQACADDPRIVPPKVGEDRSSDMGQSPFLPLFSVTDPLPQSDTSTRDSAQEGRDGQAKDQPGEQEKIAGLEKTVAELSKKLTVVTADENFKLVIGGAITADFLFNSARPVAAGIPFFLSPGPLGGFKQDTFDANARQTTLFALVSGPKICDLQSGGFILVSLYNDALIVDRYGILPIEAFAELKNEDWRLAAGLQLDIFNPVNPTILPFSLLAGSGNTGMYRGQFRVERFLHPSDDRQITLSVGLGEPLPTTVSNTFRISEDNGWPNVEGRAALAVGPLVGQGPEAQRPFEVGVSGMVGQIRTTVPATVQVVADAWGLGTDMRWSLTDRFGVKGEFFIGETLGTYGGGILQTINSVTFGGVHAVGGWAEVYYYLCPEKLHTHIGYGIDDPLDRDLAPGQPVENQTCFTNLIWDVTNHFRLAGEVTYRKTMYTVVPNNDGFGVQTQVQLKF